MSRIAKLCVLVFGLTIAGHQATFAQESVTFTLKVENIPSAKGQVLASLCDDPTARIPGPCRTYSVKAPAQAGTTALAFTGVKPGVYSLQVIHDQNDNGRLDFPQDGYAFGNDSAFPPSFTAAAITVATGTTAHVHLVSTFSNGTDVKGSSGVEAPAGITKTDLRSDGLYGELYMPAHQSAPLPLIIAIGGSEGGLDTTSAFSITLAQHGYALLVLAYWKEPGLPPSLEGVPLEYFDNAIAWARRQSAIDPTRIGMIGWSRGAEAALLVGSSNPNLHAIVAISPSAYVWQGLNFASTGPMKPAWTVAGVPLPSIVPANMRSGDRMAQLFVDKLDEAKARPETAIAVEKIHGPILLLTGSDDALWPSDLMAKNIVVRLRAHHFGYDVEHTNYTGAGHAVFAGDPAAAGGFDDSVTENFLGGSTQANKRARQDSWARVLGFFEKALRGKERK